MSDEGITHYVGDSCQGGHYHDSQIADLERKLAEAQGKLTDGMGQALEVELGLRAEIARILKEGNDATPRCN